MYADMTVNFGAERFQSDAEKYAAYLETPGGRLRVDLAFAGLQESLPETKASLRALDLGCGTGAIGVRLARLGFRVTLLDGSRSMLDLAARAAQEAGIADSIAAIRGDAGQLGSLFDPESFDVVVCHNILEFVEDPCAVLRNAARMLRDSSSIISILVRNRAGEVLKAALLDRDLAAAGRNLDAEWGDESLYGGKVRLFTPTSLRRMLMDSSLAVTAERGVRVVSDYLSPRLSQNDDYGRIFELERKLGQCSEFAALARYTHCVARRADTGMKV